MYDIVIRYEDGSRETVENHFDDLGEACAYVLDLADRLAEAHGEDESDPAQWVEIHREHHLEISVSVVRGGLLKPRGA